MTFRPLVSSLVCLIGFGLLLIGSGSSGQEPLQPTKWAFDIVHLKNGRKLNGLILEETQTHLRFQDIRQRSGRPTVLFSTIFARREIDRIDHLSAEDREVLKTRVRELDLSGTGERTRMEKLELRRVDWVGRPESAWRYDSDYFTLLANTSEDLVRRSAVRLEQIYAAYSRFLPARFEGGKPTTVLIYESRDEYEKLLRAEDRKLVNPAFFDPPTNRILICVHELKRFTDDLDDFRKKSSKLQGELLSKENEIRRLYASKKDELARHLQPIQETRKNIQAANAQNDRLFNKLTAQHFSILYHEAFHAYAHGFVFPPVGPTNREAKAVGELPRWLNEGLAQVFETALVEAGELRLGHTDPERLKRIKELLAKHELTPLAELLRSGGREFIVVHGGDRIGSDRAYLTSWGFVSYLLFERKWVGTPAFDEFVRAVNQKCDPVKAFAKNLDQPFDEFEKEFHAYLHRLQADGTLAPLSSAKP